MAVIIDEHLVVAISRSLMSVIVNLFVFKLLICILEYLSLIFIVISSTGGN